MEWESLKLKISWSYETHVLANYATTPFGICVISNNCVIEQDETIFEKSLYYDVNVLRCWSHKFETSRLKQKT